MGPAAHAITAAVELYRRTLGRLLFDRCRMRPTCWAYWLEAVRIHGASRGTWLGVRRLARCGRAGAPGDDPVPDGTADGTSVNRKIVPDRSPGRGNGEGRGSVSR